MSFQKGHPKYTTKGDFKKGNIPWIKDKKLGFIPKMAYKKGVMPWIIKEEKRGDKSWESARLPLAWK